MPIVRRISRILLLRVTGRGVQRDFDGVADRLDYLASLGVNCLELMPVTSNKLDFDWGYGSVYHYSPSAHFGGSDGLERLVNAAHARGMAVILDVVSSMWTPHLRTTVFITISPV